MLVDVAMLITAYYSNVPDVAVAGQRVAFGTSGHRGSAFDNSFNEWHILAISQAICEYRRQPGIDGPLFLGNDTHALSEPAFASALEVLAANGVEVMLADKHEYTSTPVISHAILTYNRGRADGLADGIVITPSHNPPDNGGFKYNPPNGGPAGPALALVSVAMSGPVHRSRELELRSDPDKTKHAGRPATAGIGYVHVLELGGRRHSQRDSLKTGWYNASFRRCADYMLTPLFAEGPRTLIDMPQRASCARKRFPGAVISSLIADVMTWRGVRVQHLLGTV
jgi:hypothetical protein